MTELAKSIIELRAKGYTYKQIQNELGCSQGLISYHVANGYEKQNIRLKKHRSQHPYVNKTRYFLDNGRKRGSCPVKNESRLSRLCSRKVERFFRDGKGNKVENSSFNFRDVINKFGETPKCYLTGEDIDIYKTSSYSFDHIIPKSRGGTNSIENLGITTRLANSMKTDMTPDELIYMCKRILEYNGYDVEKKKPG